METLRELVSAAAGRADVRDAVASVYSDLQQEIEARKPVCHTSGRCCHFDDFGHRLYVTTMELAAFVASKPAVGFRSAASCGFQVDGLCSVHSIRPFGCRIFFCDATAQTWQTTQYERFHARLKQLHDELGVAYRYVEWRAALAELGLLTADPVNPTPQPKLLSLPQLRL